MRLFMNVLKRSKILFIGKHAKGVRYNAEDVE